MISSFDFLRALSASVVRQAHYVLSPSKDAVRYESFITVETRRGRAATESE